jgi:hypothetical protein
VRTHVPVPIILYYCFAICRIFRARRASYYRRQMYRGQVQPSTTRGNARLSIQFSSTARLGINVKPLQSMPGARQPGSTRFPVTSRTSRLYRSHVHPRATIGWGVQARAESAGFFHTARSQFVTFVTFCQPSLPPHIEFYFEGKMLDGSVEWNVTFDCISGESTLKPKTH